MSGIAAKKIEAAKEDLSEVKAKIESLKKELDSSQAAHKDATVSYTHLKALSASTSGLPVVSNFSP